jgi:hypothetical protein
MRTRTISSIIFIIALASIIGFGCGATRKSGLPIEESGFLVDTPQPATMRLTIALTHAGERNVTLDTFSTYVPFSRALVELQGLAKGKPAFVGYTISKK